MDQWSDLRNRHSWPLGTHRQPFSSCTLPTSLLGGSDSVRADRHGNLHSLLFPFPPSLSLSAYRTALPTFSFGNRGVCLILSTPLPTARVSPHSLGSLPSIALTLLHVPSVPHQPLSSGAPLDCTATAPVPAPESQLTTTASTF